MTSSDEAPDLVMFSVGERGHLTGSSARKAAYAFRKIVTDYPQVFVILHFSGWDNDPRALWEFPNVCRYARKWALLAGVDRPDAPHAANLSESSFEVLCRLGVFGPNVHWPFEAFRQ
jgi:hypothetical protein